MNLYSHTPETLNINGPRDATDSEALAYMIMLRDRAGLPALECEMVGGYRRDGKGSVRYFTGATFGGKTNGKNDAAAKYASGSYSIAMPGHAQEYGAITVETLDDAGNVVRSSRIGLDAKGKLSIDMAKVRTMVGPIEKPAKPAKPAASAPKRRKASPKPVASPKRSPAHLRAIRAYLDLRQRRALDVTALDTTIAAYKAMASRAGVAEERNRGLEMENERHKETERQDRTALAALQARAIAAEEGAALARSIVDAVERAMLDCGAHGAAVMDRAEALALEMAA